ncbi:MAG: DUF2304 domain-containing protein [Bacteroidetes bacterium]|nr:DUF2304 domain-containing protein [Bacteroidota bacterium]MBS1929765.1 DUF2304 domain-containing protein [Bacteroidota bacterium]
MSGIKILLITCIAFIAVYFFVRLRSSLFDLALLLLLLGTAVLFVILPDLTNRIAHYLGVGRGADLVFYISIIIFWFVILKLYARIRKLEQIITGIIRKDAIDSADQNKNTQ